MVSKFLFKYSIGPQKIKLCCGLFWINFCNKGKSSLKLIEPMQLIVIFVDGSIGFNFLSLLKLFKSNPWGTRTTLLLEIVLANWQRIVELANIKFAFLVVLKMFFKSAKSTKS